MKKDNNFNLNEVSEKDLDKISGGASNEKDPFINLCRDCGKEINIKNDTHADYSKSRPKNPSFFRVEAMLCMDCFNKLSEDERNSPTYGIYKGKHKKNTKI